MDGLSKYVFVTVGTTLFDDLVEVWQVVLLVVVSLTWRRQLTTLICTSV